MNTDQRLTEIFKNVFDDDSIVLSDDLSSTKRSDWDSITNLNLMFAIEQEFGIVFASSEFSRLTNVGDLRKFVSTKLQSS